MSDDAKTPAAGTPPVSPEAMVASQVERLRAQAAANLAEAQKFLEQERRRLAELLSVQVQPPAPMPVGMDEGLKTIDRTMQTTMDYLSKHLNDSAVPQAPGKTQP